MANSFTFGTTSVSSATYRLTVLDDAEFPLLASPRVFTREAAQGFGGASRYGGLSPLTIPISVVVSGDDPADLWTKLDALKTLLDPSAGEQNLYLDWVPNRYWKAMLVSEISMPSYGAVHKKFQLVFRASDPRAYSTTARSTPNFTISSDPDTMTIEAAAVVAGNTDADCVWIIDNTSGGAVTSLTLNNTTKVESVTWTGSLADTNWLRIDTARGVIEKTVDDGANYTDAMSGVSGTFVLPTLKAGSSNSVTISGFSGATVGLTYTARYL